ncbi:MAG: ComF family protein [Candidatus Delongbacteria bacterium]|nr:ComF family protein [Candidatus Delongbacteria bacterium]MBN2836064.1 ComF family protein [Candidatus Delongbacteria bacterium]
MKIHRNSSSNFYSLFDFSKEMQRALYLLKYDHRKELGFELGKLIGKRILEYFNKEENIILVPIPIHKHKRYIRDYNQSEMIVKGIVEITGWKDGSMLVSRTVFTKSQTTMNKYQRKENVRSVFTVHELSEKKATYFIIDDVITTGATTLELKKNFEEKGIDKVGIISVASPHKDFEEL